MCVPCEDGEAQALVKHREEACVPVITTTTTTTTTTKATVVEAATPPAGAESNVAVRTTMTVPLPASVDLANQTTTDDVARQVRRLILDTTSGLVVDRVVLEARAGAPGSSGATVAIVHFGAGTDSLQIATTAAALNKDIGAGVVAFELLVNGEARDVVVEGKVAVGVSDDGSARPTAGPGGHGGSVGNTDSSAEGTSGDDTNSAPMIIAAVVGVLVLVAAVACAAHKYTGGSKAVKAGPRPADGAHLQAAAQRVANAVYDLGYTDRQDGTRGIAPRPNTGAMGSAPGRHAGDLAGRKVPNPYDLEEPQAPHHYDLVEAKTPNVYDLGAPATSNHYDLEEADVAGTRGRGKPTSANAYDLEEVARVYDLGEPTAGPNAYDLEAPHTYDLGATPDDNEACDLGAPVAPHVYDLGAPVAPHVYDLGSAPGSTYDLGAGPQPQAYNSMSEEEI